MSVMKEAYTRNIQVLDYSDSSGDVIAVTSPATLLDDLIFLYDASREECPKVYEACVALAQAYVDGEPYDEPADFLRIELREV